MNAEDPKKLFLKDEKMIYKNDPKKEKQNSNKGKREF